MKKVLLGACLALAMSGCVGTDPALMGPKWKPIGNRKARVVHWGIIHNHSRGKYTGMMTEIFGIDDPIIP